jgi:hypothetical protein
MRPTTDWASRLQGAGGAGVQTFVFKAPLCSPRAVEEEEEETVEVRAFVGAASDDFDDTGTVLWPAAPLLCYFLITDAGRRLVRGASVLELGAGVGIPSLLAGRSCRRLVVTDHNAEVIARSRRENVCVCVCVRARACLHVRRAYLPGGGAPGGQRAAQQGVKPVGLPGCVCRHARLV